MNITAGTKLGPYEVIAPLGAGGMGEVYRARDARLRREVALKVLPADVAADAARRARFEQEAHAAAALNHPNILGVHDIGSDSGVFYIATELVSGETLAATIGRGPLPVRTLLDIAVQIADGMACAHAAHIVHRDLKPANVMIAADGRVKILDFGLAKQTARVATGDETIMTDHTEPGMIVGTVSYMSPEQARGKPADFRSDQFSFGLVLYEMATAQKAFDRAESVQTMSAIISDEPPPIDSRVPAPLRWVIDRCLAKDPAGRYESSRDLFHELRSLRDHLSEVSTQVERPASLPEPLNPKRARLALPVAVGIVVGVAVTLLTILVRSGPALPDQSAYRFTPFSFEPGGQGWPVWSPDGKAVAYSARQAVSEPYQIFLHNAGAPTPLQLTHVTESAYPVAWSPDSRRVHMLMVRENLAALWTVPIVGGEPELFMTLPKESIQGSTPTSLTISPDNKTVAVLVRADDGVQVAISSPPGSEPKNFSPNPFASKTVFNRPWMRFSPDGTQILLMLNGGRRGEEAWVLEYPPQGEGSARQVLPNLVSYGGTPPAAWMPDNRHVVLSVQPSPESALQLWLADTVTGRSHALTSGTRGAAAAAVSPTGEQIVLAENSGHYDVISLDLTTAEARPIIATERDELMPAWAATQAAIVYVTNRAGRNEIWLHREGNPDRSIASARDFPADTTQWFMAPALSPRGDRVAYVRIDSKATISRLWISAAAGGAPIQLTNDSVAEFPGSWSPDGAWFVYPALRDGKAHLMKVKTSGQATPTMLKEVSESAVPSWSPTGDWIAYGNELISSDGKTTRSLADRNSPHYVFSQDGKLLYGLRAEKTRQILFSIDVATGAEKIIGDMKGDFPPGSNLGPAIRFSLAPDGKSFIYGSGRFKTNLWLLEGFAPKKGFFSR